MRTINDLLKHEGRVYVFLRDRETADGFIEAAAKEGVTYRDGKALCERNIHDLYALNDNLTVNYVNWIGHMAFYSFAESPNNRIVRVDFAKFMRGDSDYIIRNKAALKTP